MDDLGTLLNEMRQDEERGDTGALLLALKQGQRALQVKKTHPKTWKADLHENVGKAKSTWFQRAAVVRDFGIFLLPEIPDDHVATLFGSLALLTSLTKGTDEKCRQAHLEAIAGLSFADVKAYVQERKGKIPCDCCRFREETILVCEDCGKKQKKTVDGDA